MLTCQSILSILILQTKWLRQLFSSHIPKPGEGATKEERDAAYWELRVVGVTQEEPGVTPKVVQAIVEVWVRAGGMSESIVIHQKASAPGTVLFVSIQDGLYWTCLYLLVSMSNVCSKFAGIAWIRKRLINAELA